MLPGDLFHAQRSRPDLTAPEAYEMSPVDLQATLRRTRAAYHPALADSVQAGMDVVGDHALNEPWRIADLVEVCVGLDVLLVHLRADPDGLDRREGAHGDREIGTARSQAQVVYAHPACDLEIDTTGRTPEKVAEIVSELVSQPPETRAFDKLRASHLRVDRQNACGTDSPAPAARDLPVGPAGRTRQRYGRGSPGPFSVQTDLAS